MRMKEWPLTSTKHQERGWKNIECEEEEVGEWVAEDVSKSSSSQGSEEEFARHLGGGEDGVMSSARALHNLASRAFHHEGEDDGGDGSTHHHSFILQSHACSQINSPTCAA
ncbi:hypothetical protein EmuJ_000754100 [Echinococcus multilocularis]|uniref:Uncharacterized protein n=1 Tax=Echinococcus multilocularis TaxID=6211 RepID=U6HRR4_ECHMU|nr:hypothetical protein EmuJ_000754000 [Echinococcus multilocularis]CDS39981.1 hypothetical protein EmuJ_000754100 [Echinococcus multilocularis]